MDSQTIQAALRQAAQEKIKTYPCNNIRASEIGHPCERYLVLSITNWEDRKPHDASLQNIFDLGNAIEAEVIRRIKEAGFEILTARKNFKIEKPLITGREDIMLQDPETGELYPCEIKGLAPMTFDKLNSIEDMLRHKAYYIRKYPAQLQVYLFNFGKEKGFFILFNKVSGAIKAIEVHLDYEYTEQLLQKSERVYEHMANGTLPEMLDDESVCADCPLIHVCGAKVDRGDTLIDTGELEAILRRRDELLPYAREFSENKRHIKVAMRDCNTAFTASYFVRKTVFVRRPYIVAGSIQTREIIRKIGA